MRAVIQRVSGASVTVYGRITGSIGPGLVILLGVGTGDTLRDADSMLARIAGLRIFEDVAGKMNLSVRDIGGGLLIVSQFTLYGDCRKGRRPSFTEAAPPELAKNIYEYFVDRSRDTGLNVATGEFRAMMSVALVNDGPVTILIDSHKAF